MLRGVCTVGFSADDLNAAARWYSELLNTEPYFRAYECETCEARAFGVGHCAECGTAMQLGYIEFWVGDDQVELGFIDRRYLAGKANAPGSATVAWHVDDLTATMETLLAMGATAHEPITEQGGSGSGFVTASVIDPFGNVLGIYHNPHYLDMLAARHKA
ncbi:VOC family protein [Kribbella albertanoniae]|uniref:VOC family protein n=1 Tax=Kribbella albertanoniae TaxID=1266829 RepID=A0A4V2XR98_9ACTN|nr:VOC family protein [Kribbella albertanoniae]TDC29055.1 VOC family protein [Kribbella albertanoniae]